MQFWKISTNAVPSKPCAASSTTAQAPLVDVDRARDELGAGAERERARRDGRVERPGGLDGERVPGRDVGEYWPFVRP